MSIAVRKPRRLERHRAKVAVKKIAEAPGKGKAHVREGKAVNLRAALAMKKVTGKKTRELDALGVADLEKKLAEARAELFNLRFKHATAQLESVALIPAAKKRIARILTLIKQKEVGA